MSETRVSHRPERSDYEVTVDGRHAGLLAYADTDGQRVLLHTEVDDEFEGHGVGSALVRGVLDDVRAAGLTVVPQCSFVRAWLQRHPEAGDLVA